MMKKILLLLTLMVFTSASAESIETLLTEGYEIKSAATVAAGGMYFILQNGPNAYFCPALDPSKVMDCRKVKAGNSK